MNETDRQTHIAKYIEEVTSQFYSGQAREHSYRPALERLMMSFDKVHAVNEPKHSDFGAPDFVFLSNNNNDLILGYAEAKDITVSLDRTEKTEQMQRYAGYANLFLTDYLEFRFFRNGEKYETITLGHIKDGKVYKNLENSQRLMRELEAFLEQTPEKITNGKRLAKIMGGKARRIRDNVAAYLKNESGEGGEFERMFEMMRKMLVHDLTPDKFADMYAQTLVYGLFVARYGDITPDSFTRGEARDLVPTSNPFLRHFFDHIVGPNFDIRLGYIVDELCEIFSVSDVQAIVHKHLKIADETTDVKDPIIHFYEDFLQEYDAAERKKMGAYYTPIPVVQYIVKQVDRILREDFGIVDGLASNETTNYEIETGQDLRADRRKLTITHQTITVPRVQVLDPAVGTATFLNETIKFVHKRFAGQEGRWPAYVNDNLIKRLHGFELMMAPYTIAHLKLGMTLRETGVEKIHDRLGVYLTNTLEEGIPTQTDLFSFGLAQAVSEESRLAAEVKSERPVMVVMGNPPYSVSSNNKSKYIQALIADYKKDLNERKINLDDDYIKFIRFSEEMVTKNGSGIVAMITNNSYIDGITHRQMRKHLLQTFDKIYVLDLHGNSKKKEVTPEGTKDENVFDIMSGVSIVLMVKTTPQKHKELAEVYHSELWGKRTQKFEALKSRNIEYRRVSVIEPYNFFVPKDTSSLLEYSQFISIDNLFVNGSSGFRSGQDDPQIAWDRVQISGVVNDLIRLPEQDYRDKYKLKDGRNHHYVGMRSDVMAGFEPDRVINILYRPFDIRWTYYSKKSSSFAARPRNSTMNNFVFKRNIGLVSTRQAAASNPLFFDAIFLTEIVADENFVRRGSSQVFPLYVYSDSGVRTPNFNQVELSALLRNVPYILEDLEDGEKVAGSPDTITPENILDYVYAVLHSPYYREKYKEFLKTDFPRIPAPEDVVVFWKKSHIGHQLRELHLMKSPLLNTLDTTYPVSGNNVVEAVSYEDEKVRINAAQYFGNVSESAWNFYIGGYQPAQKWLKDRKGRELSDDDIVHYQKLVKVLVETVRIMNELDSELERF
jgi:predicted helicase